MMLLGVGIALVGLVILGYGTGEATASPGASGLGTVTIVIGAITFVIGIWKNHVEKREEAEVVAWQARRRAEEERLEAKERDEAAAKARVEQASRRRHTTARLDEEALAEGNREAARFSPTRADELARLRRKQLVEQGVRQRPEGIEWWRTKQEVGARDDWRCRRCRIVVTVYPDGAPPASDRFEVDHIVPFTLGGSNDKANLQTLCHDCNLSKGIRTVRY